MDSSVRTHLVKSLYKNLLGPKNGYDEIIEAPLANYHIGVLTSHHHTKYINDDLITDPAEKNFRKPDHYQSLDYFNSVQDNDLEWPDTELDLNGSFTLGLSFMVSGSNPKIKVCNTWGRYEYKNTTKNLKIFQRKSNFYLTEWLDVKSFENNKIIKLEDSNGNTISIPGVELHLRSTKLSNEEKWTVQVFLVNNTKFLDKTDDDKPKRQDEIPRVFQPQIRIKVDELTTVEYLRETSNIDSKKDSSMLIFDGRGTKARGFQCGAIWKEIDPEAATTEDSFRNFTWPDKESGIIPKNIVDDFTCPDVRTDYLPAYTILQPESSQREYDAFELSEMWESETLRSYLSKLSKRYEDWISKQKVERENSKNFKYNSGKENLKKCEESLNEIQSGINLICDDQRARLAFCFMNSVMNEKMKVEMGENLKWREFQMAFILQTISDVSRKNRIPKPPVDVLWFPTGGGKTEAYLGIVVFAIAYKRLMRLDDCKIDGEIFNNDGGVNVISRYTLRLLTIQQFQRTLGAVIISDLRRVENWIPKKLEKEKIIIDDELDSKFKSGNLWGKTRFSIGLWIGGDATPTRFAYMKSEKGSIVLNAEGALLSSENLVKKNSKSSKGDPTQIQTCPICKNLLSFPQNHTNKKEEFSATWIIKTKLSISDLESIKKSEFDEPYGRIIINEGPYFSEISQLSDGKRFVRVRMKVLVKSADIRSTVNKWWEQIVEKNFTADGIALTSTNAAMPGYFFLTIPGESRPYDFTIYCTNENCKLNKKEWFEDTVNENNSIPEAFLKPESKSKSNSIPISAFTVDEQVYTKCPTVIIATVDKFANLPWDPRCASIFGNRPYA